MTNSNDILRKQIADKINAANKILFLTHGRPDGDGLGSMLALAIQAQEAGKEVNMLLWDRIPNRHQPFFKKWKIARIKDFDRLADQADLIMVVDTCAEIQLDGVAEGVKKRRHKVAVIDHHATTDDIADLMWVDHTAAATGVLAEELIEELGWDLCEKTAEGILMAVVSDTGWLKFSNTDPRCLHAIARCIEAGVKPDVMYRRLYQRDRINCLKLQARLMESLELQCDRKLAVMMLNQQDFRDTRARADEAENFVNEGLRIKTVQASILLTETKDCIRVSLRSRENIDVAKLANQFGGGGHARAAGLRSTLPIEEIKQKLIEEFSKHLED